jgi:RNA polymerase sigma-70 factor (ECF subfamily)
MDNKMTPEDQLIARAKDLDEQALAEIYDTYSTQIFRYAMRLLGNRDLAEECVAETFSRLLQAFYKGGGPKRYLRAYIYRVAHNWVTDQFRKREHQQLELIGEPAPDLENEPQQVADREVERQELRVALRRLTPDQRQVIMLKFFEGCSNDEVARALEKPVGAVKSLQHRGLNALRRSLRIDEQEGG